MPSWTFDIFVWNLERKQWSIKSVPLARWRSFGSMFVFFFNPPLEIGLTLKRVPIFFFLRGFFVSEASIICVVGSNIVYIHPETWGEDAIGLAHILALSSPPFNYIALLFVHFCFQSGQNRTARGPKKTAHSWNFISKLIVKVGVFFS